MMRPSPAHTRTRTLQERLGIQQEIAVTAVIMRIKVSVEANDKYFALSRQHAGRAQR